MCSPPCFAAFGEWEIVDRMVWRPGFDSQSLVDSRSSTTPSGQRIFIVYTLYLGCFRVALYLLAQIGYRTWGTEQDVICPDCAVAFPPCTLNPQCFVSRGILFRLGNRCQAEASCPSPLTNTPIAPVALYIRPCSVSVDKQHTNSHRYDTFNTLDT